MSLTRSGSFCMSGASRRRMPRLMRARCVDGVHLVHVVALAARHHLERQLVVIAQKDRPLAGLGNVGRLLHDVHDRVAVLLGDRHVDPRHQGEVERHVALVARSEVLGDVLRPLVRLGEEEPVVVVRVERGAHLLQHRVGLGQVLVGRAVALAQVGDGVEPHPVHAQVEPVAHDADHGPHDVGVREIEIGLVREEAVPVVAPSPPGPRSSWTSRYR